MINLNALDDVSTYDQFWYCEKVVNVDIPYGAEEL